MDPDESTIHSSYKSCSEKCTTGVTQPHASSASRCTLEASGLLNLEQVQRAL
jgi:hypothetical protein